MSIVPPRREASPAAAPTAREPAPRTEAVLPVGRRVARRLLEGPHQWGELETWGGRYGSTSCCLVVHPPGTTRSARIRYRAMRGWPSLGILLGLLAGIAIAQRYPLIVAIGAGAAVYAAGAMGLAAVAGPGRHGIRTLYACRGDEGVGDIGRADDLDRFAAVLIESERRHRAGALDAVGFEAAWGAVWSELERPRSARR